MTSLRGAPPEPPGGYDLAVFDVLDSTNAEARRRAEDGAVGPLWIWAQRQTAGVGRRGRAWESGVGDLACTLLTPAPWPAQIAAQLSFVAALAVADVLAPRAPAARLSLKWPNDVLADGAKIAGVLLELWSVGDGRAALGLGVGVNVVTRPERTPYPATRLLDHAGAGDAGRSLAAGDLLGDLMRAWRERFAQWERRGFAAVRAEWLAQAHGLGGPIEARAPGLAIAGRFDGLDADGRLLMTTDDGTARTVAAADVFFSK